MHPIRRLAFEPSRVGKCMLKRGKTMKVVIVGAGMMSRAIAYDLVRQPKISQVVVIDQSLKRAQDLVRGVRSKKLCAEMGDATDAARMAQLFAGAACVVGATTYSHNTMLAQVAIDARAHWCDLGGNNDVVHAQKKLSDAARQAGVWLVPDCGLAPGLINVLAAHLCDKLDKVDRLSMRVGGLPQTPSGLLKYALVFSVEGLINEYLEPAEVVIDHRRKKIPSMGDVELLRFPKPWGVLEAFTTSGGTSSLPRRLAKRVRHLDYKTLRFAGHAAQIQLLLELGLAQSEPQTLASGICVPPREVLASVLADYLDRPGPDAVLMRVSASGQRDGKAKTLSWDAIDVADTKQKLSAMQRTTGFSVAITAGMLARGELAPGGGVATQDEAVNGAALKAELAKRGIVFAATPKRFLS